MEQDYLLTYNPSYVESHADSSDFESSTPPPPTGIINKPGYRFVKALNWQKNKDLSYKQVDELPTKDNGFEPHRAKKCQANRNCTSLDKTKHKYINFSQGDQPEHKLSKLFILRQKVLPCLSTILNRSSAVIKLIQCKQKHMKCQHCQTGQERRTRKIYPRQETYSVRPAYEVRNGINISNNTDDKLYARYIKNCNSYSSCSDCETLTLMSEKLNNKNWQIKKKFKADMMREHRNYQKVIKKKHRDIQHPSAEETVLQMYNASYQTSESHYITDMPSSGFWDYLFDRINKKYLVNKVEVKACKCGSKPSLSSKKSSCCKPDNGCNPIPSKKPSPYNKTSSTIKSSPSGKLSPCYKQNDSRNPPCSKPTPSSKPIKSPSPCDKPNCCCKQSCSSKSFNKPPSPSNSQNPSRKPLTSAKASLSSILSFCIKQIPGNKPVKNSSKKQSPSSSFPSTHCKPSPCTKPVSSSKQSNCSINSRDKPPRSMQSFCRKPSLCRKPSACSKPSPSSKLTCKHKPKEVSCQCSNIQCKCGNKISVSEPPCAQVPDRPKRNLPGSTVISLPRSSPLLASPPCTPPPSSLKCSPKPSPRCSPECFLRCPAGTGNKPCQVSHNTLTQCIRDKYNGEILCIHNPPCILINGCLNLPPTPCQKADARTQNNSGFWPVLFRNRPSLLGKKKNSTDVVMEEKGCQYVPPYIELQCDTMTGLTAEKKIQSVCGHNPPCEVVRCCHNEKYDPTLQTRCIHVPMCKEYPECVLNTSEKSNKCSHTSKCPEIPVCCRTWGNLTTIDSFTAQVEPNCPTCRHDPPCVMVPKCLGHSALSNYAQNDQVPNCGHSPTCDPVPACCRKIGKQMVSVSSQYPNSCRIV